MTIFKSRLKQETVTDFLAVHRPHYSTKWTALWGHLLVSNFRNQGTAVSPSKWTLNYTGKISGPELITNCVLPPFGAWMDWFLDILPGIALRFHPLLVGHTCAQQHQECWWYRHAAPRQSVQGHLRCPILALRTILKWNCAAATVCSQASRKNWKQFYYPNACETTVIWMNMCAFIHI